EDVGRDLQCPMGFFEAEVSAARLRRSIALGSARKFTEPKRAHELEPWKPVWFVAAPFVEPGVLRPLTCDRVAHDPVAEAVDHRRDRECTTEPFVKARFRHVCYLLDGSAGTVRSRVWVFSFPTGLPRVRAISVRSS